MSDDVLLRADGVEKYFPVDQSLLDRLLGDPKHVRAVDGVDLTVRRRETVGLVGESGCGKSTLGRVLANLHEPTAGTVEFDGVDTSSLSRSEAKALRREVQFIFQDPLSSLNPRKTAGEIVRKPLDVHGAPEGTTARERARELFDEVGLDESHLDRYPHELSGGQQQRVGIARALTVEPKLVVADEPVSALDVSVQSQIINLMKRVQREYDLSYVFIAHDLSVVKHISDRVAVMYLGEVVERSSTEELFGDPRHPYTRALLSSVPRIDAPRDSHRSPLQGTPPSPIDPPSGCSFRTRCPEYIGDVCRESDPELERYGGTGDHESEGTGDAVHEVACHWLRRSADERETDNPLILDEGAD